MLKRNYALPFSSLLIILPLQAETMDECLLRQLGTADNDTPVAVIKQTCAAFISSTSDSAAMPQNILARRIIKEREDQDNPFVITPHKPNYILPITVMDEPNQLAWASVPDDDGKVLEDEEAVFQLSIKVPISTNGVFTENDGFYFGYTVKSYWQLYNSDHSRPFRETNYNPEIFYFTPLPYKLLGGDTGMTMGYEHQSNGRSQLLSRSWDRIYVNFLWANEQLAMSFRPWYRIEEDAEDDDNPDIDDYMGNFEYKIAYKFMNGYQLSGLFRQNFEESNGAAEIGFSFPLSHKIRGYVQYFNGYGENLFDYNYEMERIGVGIMLNDVL